MAKRSIPCPTRVRLALRYNPETGGLFWQDTHRLRGKMAFNCPTGTGYLQGGICGYVTSAHRVIWAIVNGYWPKQIDHINGNRSDNRLVNLREVDDAENRKNTALRSDNKSGFHGVRWNASLNKWRVEIKANGKPKHIGVYVSKDDAIAARKAAEAMLGYHANHGRTG